MLSPSTPLPPALQPEGTSDLTAVLKRTAFVRAVRVLSTMFRASILWPSHKNV